MGKAPLSLYYSNSCSKFFLSAKVILSIFVTFEWIQSHFLKEETVLTKTRLTLRMTNMVCGLSDSPPGSMWKSIAHSGSLYYEAQTQPEAHSQQELQKGKKETNI